MRDAGLDMEVLDELKAEFGADTLLELLLMARSGAAKELNLLAIKMEANAHDEIRRIAHTLIGILGQYGAEAAAACARETQMAKQENLFLEAEALIKACEAAIEAMDNYASELGAPITEVV